MAVEWRLAGSQVYLRTGLWPVGEKDKRPILGNRNSPSSYFAEEPLMRPDKQMSCGECKAFLYSNYPIWHFFMLIIPK